MNIRPADQSDAKRIADIHRCARRHAMPWLPVLHSAEGDYRFIKNNVLINDTVFVAQVGDDVVGCIAFNDDWVNHLYIYPGHWRDGIGTALLAFAKAASNRLQLWVFQQNQSARQFYLANGFEEAEFTDGQTNEEKTPDVRMVWRAN